QQQGVQPVGPDPGHGGGCGTFHVWDGKTPIGVLFPFWTVKTTTEYIVSMIVIFILAFLYEGLLNVQQVCDRRMQSGTKASKYTASQQLLRAALHTLRVFSSLMLMLVFMLFEWGLAIALVVGAGVGFFVFSTSDTPQNVQRSSCH
ncbi:hypothetical protein PBRA_005450, partial [Plasmodiophora brassicae]